MHQNAKKAKSVDLDCLKLCEYRKYSICWEKGFLLWKENEYEEKNKSRYLINL
jgi:hypothetical protein